MYHPYPLRFSFFSYISKKKSEEENGNTHCSFLMSGGILLCTIHKYYRVNFEFFKLVNADLDM